MIPSLPGLMEFEIVDPLVDNLDFNESKTPYFEYTFKNKVEAFT
jgi:hypothetical protein